MGYMDQLSQVNSKEDADKLLDSLVEWHVEKEKCSTEHAKEIQLKNIGYWINEFDEPRRSQLMGWFQPPELWGQKVRYYNQE